MTGEKAPAFTEEEKAILVSMFSDNKDILQGQFAGAAGGNIRKRKWDEIVEAVNAVGNNNRTKEQLQKKMKNMKQTVKSKASSNKRSFGKTGGGSDEDDELNPIEAKILTTISTRQIHGIDGGLDPNEIKNKKLKFEEKGQLQIPAVGAGSMSAGQQLAPASAENLNRSIVMFDPRDVGKSTVLEISIPKEQQSEQGPSSSERRGSFSFTNTAEKEIEEESPFFVNRKNLTDRRKSYLLSEGPQTKLMKEQVAAVGEQVKAFQSVEKILQQLLEVETQKLSVMTDCWAFVKQWMEKMEANPFGKFPVEDDLE